MYTKYYLHWHGERGCDTQVIQFVMQLLVQRQLFDLIKALSWL